MIYEDDQDVDKALQFGLIAAHLNPSDCEEWIRLADMSLEQDNIRQAIFCYSKGECDAPGRAHLLIHSLAHPLIPLLSHQTRPHQRALPVGALQPPHAAGGAQTLHGRLQEDPLAAAHGGRRALHAAVQGHGQVWRGTSIQIS